MINLNFEPFDTKNDLFFISSEGRKVDFLRLKLFFRFFFISSDEVEIFCFLPFSNCPDFDQKWSRIGNLRFKLYLYTLEHKIHFGCLNLYFDHFSYLSLSISHFLFDEPLHGWLVFNVLFRSKKKGKILGK